LPINCEDAGILTRNPQSAWMGGSTSMKGEAHTSGTKLVKWGNLR
jgi:hypothetical protein